MLIYFHYSECCRIQNWWPVAAMCQWAAPKGGSITSQVPQGCRTVVAVAPPRPAAPQLSSATVTSAMMSREKTSDSSSTRLTCPLSKSPLRLDRPKVERIDCQTCSVPAFNSVGNTVRLDLWPLSRCLDLVLSVNKSNIISLLLIYSFFFFFVLMKLENLCNQSNNWNKLHIDF